MAANYFCKRRAGARVVELESARAQVKDLKKQKFLGKRGVDAVAWPPLDKFFPNADWVVGESQ